MLGDRFATLVAVGGILLGVSLFCLAFAARKPSWRGALWVLTLTVCSVVGAQLLVEGLSVGLFKQMSDRFVSYGWLLGGILATAVVACSYYTQPRSRRINS